MHPKFGIAGDTNSWRGTTLVEWLRCGPSTAWAAKNSHIAAVANGGHASPPPPTVISTTLRPSGHCVFDVVTDPAVVSVGSAQPFTFRQKVFSSGTDGPSMRIG
jgi:hypothetical protein